MVARAYPQRWKLASCSKCRTTRPPTEAAFIEERLRRKPFFLHTVPVGERCWAARIGPESRLNLFTILSLGQSDALLDRLVSFGTLGGRRSERDTASEPHCGA